MQIDAAQYAGIAAQMSETNSFLEVFEFDRDYLDKPPLLFWLSSLSIKLFGINNFAYKFPSFLFLIFSLYAVYRFALLYYTPKIAKNAFLILASTQAYFLMTNDVRTDALLTSCVIISVWLFSEYFEKNKFKYLIFGSIFTGLAMLTKGPIGLIAVLMPIGIQLLYFKKWNQIFSLKWIVVFLIIAALLVPMSYGLYTQFDLQPDKISYGIKGQKGLYFYYWLQSFGRITGESVWNNNTPWHFFFTSSIWDFFPWFFPLCFAIFYKFKNLFFNKKAVPEIITLAGFVLIFAMLSLSKYKLPHYVFVTFPFAAILVAEYFSDLSDKVWKNWNIFYKILGLIIVTLIIVYAIFMFKEINYFLTAFVVLQLLILLFYKRFFENCVAQLISLVIVFNLFFSFVFYPKLLTFQADSQAGNWIYENQENIGNAEVYILNEPSHAFNFNSKNPFTKVISQKQMATLKKPFFVYVRNHDLTQIKQQDFNVEATKMFVDYPITMLKLPFLLEDKRNNEILKNFIFKIDKPK